MPLFGPSAPADTRLVAVFAAPPEHERAARRQAEKALAKESDAIVRIISEADEEPLVIAYDSGSLGSSIVVITNRRSFQIKGGRIRKELAHGEVAETKLGRMPSGRMLVTIESIAAQQDYRPTDPMRFTKIVQVEVDTPRIANLICGQVDRIIGA